MHLPALRGGLLALLAALLYAGAALVGALLRRPVDREARVQWGDAGRLAAMALFGAVIGPVALAWGLQRTSGTGASLMLTLEAVFTAVLARLWYREAMDPRVAVAMALLTAGGMALVLDRAESGAAPMLGLLAVMLATASWGVDNTLSRAVAGRDPGQVVMFKGALDAIATTGLAWTLREPLPSLWQAAALLAVGATGYGLSLRMYLLAQRAFGVARTGSVFAFAPFVGAGLAFALGERAGSLWMLVVAVLMVAGIVLHLAERHAHEHVHDAQEHEHAHSHDDGHHTHTHAVMPVGSHSHVHRHEPQRHAHPHAPDEHHTHSH